MHIRPPTNAAAEQAILGALLLKDDLFHDIAGIKYGGWGIYLDEGGSNILVENNIVHHTTHGGFHQHYGKDNIFRNNVIAFGRDAQIQRTRPEAHQSFAFEHNIVYWDRGELTVGGWDSRNVVFDHNVYWNAAKGDGGANDLHIGETEIRQLFGPEEFASHGMAKK